MMKRILVAIAIYTSMCHICADELTAEKSLRFTDIKKPEESSVFSWITKNISAIFSFFKKSNFCDEEILGRFRIGIPITKIELTDKLRIITAHGIYNDRPIGFKLQIPKKAESVNLDKIKSGKKIQKIKTYSAVFSSVGDETLNLFNMLGVGKFTKIKKNVRFKFINLVGEANSIDNRCENENGCVCLSYSNSPFPRQMAKDDIRMKIATYYEDDPEQFSINGLDEPQELEFLIDVSPSEKMIYFMEQSFEDRRNLRYTFSDYEPQEINKILKFADAGDSDAQFLTGNIYEFGVTGIVKADIKKALAYWERSAVSGNAAAQIRLGDLYKIGRYVEQNFQKSRELYEEAAIRNNPCALYRLGLMYQLGEGTEADIDKALSYYKKSADLGYVYAQVAVADIYIEYKDEILKGCKIYQQVLKQKTAERNFNIGKIYYRLGLAFFYREETKVSINKKEALSFLRKAFIFGIDEAIIYYTFISTSQDIKKADCQWILDMYEKYPNNPYCLFVMGLLYARGVYLSQDYEKAFKYYKMAAESAMNIHEAMHQLASLYGRGLGTTQDPKKAFEWERKAAENIPQAQLNVGIMYLNGEGVEKNTEKAFEWFQKAAKNGIAEAEEIIKQLNY